MKEKYNHLSINNRMCVLLRCITILYNKELIRDVVQPGRTLALGARGRWFKSSHLD